MVVGGHRRVPSGWSDVLRGKSADNGRMLDFAIENEMKPGPPTSLTLYLMGVIGWRLDLRPTPPLFGCLPWSQPLFFLLHPCFATQPPRFSEHRNPTRLGQAPGLLCLIIGEF